jgi:hypothetical protein
MSSVPSPVTSRQSARALLGSNIPIPRATARTPFFISRDTTAPLSRRHRMSLDRDGFFVLSATPRTALARRSSHPVEPVGRQTPSRLPIGLG